jgi:hypothetical protein
MSTVSQPSDNLPPPEPPETVIYVDKIVNIGVSPWVSRLTFALEKSEGVSSSLTQLVIPTPALFDALEFLTKTMTDRVDVKQGIVEALDQFREKLSGGIKVAD